MSMVLRCKGLFFMIFPFPQFGFRIIDGFVYGFMGFFWSLMKYLWVFFFFCILVSLWALIRFLSVMLQPVSSWVLIRFLSVKISFCLVFVIFVCCS